MAHEDQRPWTTLLNTNDVILRVQDPAPAPPESFGVAFEVIDIKVENVTQFSMTPEQWYEIRGLVDEVIQKRLT